MWNYNNDNLTYFNKIHRLNKHFSRPIKAMSRMLATLIKKEKQSKFSPP